MTKRMIVAALSLAGIFISLYLTLYKLGVIGELTCSIGSCETVNTSKWSTFLHLPVAMWGLFFYIEVFAIAVVGTLPRFENELLVSILLVADAAFGVLFSAWLTYLELAVIHAICIWCLTSAGIVVAILLFALADLRGIRASLNIHRTAGSSDPYSENL
ncbi:MAG: vitamin K epoxide reductase family protein [Gemmatimonadota bacterium]|nr:vitamin K epoxide reductase family protein [Gemmatimonadota bacterium]